MPGSGLFRSGERLCRGTRLKCGDLIVTFCSLNRLSANRCRRCSQEKGDGRRYKSQSFPQNLRMALKDYLCGKVGEIYAIRVCGEGLLQTPHYLSLSISAPNIFHSCCWVAAFWPECKHTWEDSKP